MPTRSATISISHHGRLLDRFSTFSIHLLLLMMINTMATQQAPGAEIVCLTVEDQNNYEAVRFLNRYATQELRPAGHSVTILEGNQPLPTDIPGLVKAVPRADLLIVFIRRATPPAEQLEAIKKHLNAGKPLLGIRTANHAFLPRGKDAKPPKGGAAWPEFTPAMRRRGCLIGSHATQMLPRKRRS